MEIKDILGENKRDKAIQNKVKKGVSFEDSFF